MEALPVTLIDVLHNSLVLSQVAPYVSVRDILDLSATCKKARNLIFGSFEAFQYLNLAHVKSATIDSTPIDSGGISWRAERMDEALTEDEFYCGPLRGTFNKLHRQHILGNVNTLILDGLSVPADLVREIIAEDRFNVKILSVRECKHLNEQKLAQVLKYAVRPSRPEGTPKLRGLYFFGPKDVPLKNTAGSKVVRSDVPTPAGTGVMSAEGAQIGAEWNQKSSYALSSYLGQPIDKYYQSTGRLVKQPHSVWTETLQACEGIIAFDALLCRGPRHNPNNYKDYLKPALATVALGTKGCESCGTCPEGPAFFGQSPEQHLPLLAPPPFHTSTVRAAQCPTLASTTTESGMPPLMIRCEDCIRGRWCERCNKWWCEDCYQEPASRARLPEDLENNGWSAPTAGGNQDESVKVYFNVCVESCLRSEIMPVVDGMWG